MRRRTTLGVFIATPLTLVLFGCAAGSPTAVPQATATPAQMPSHTATRADITVGCDQFQSAGQPAELSRSTAIDVGATFALSLCSNATTGYRWEDPVIEGTDVLQFSGESFQAPSPGLVGAAGYQVFTFKGVKAGTSSVSLSYSRPWEGGEKGVWKLKLDIRVQ